MKKFFLLLGMLFSLTIYAHATDSESSESIVFLEFQKKSQSQSNHNPILELIEHKFDFLK